MTSAPPERRAVVGVMGGARVDDGVMSAALELGRLIAQRGWVLLNGGRNAGVMRASAAGARAAGGTVIGILPGSDKRSAAPDVEFAICTGMGDARNLINVLTSDVVIALSGGAGTLSEIALALKNGRTVITLGIEPGPAVDSNRQDGRLLTADNPSHAIELAAEVLQRQSSREVDV